MQDFGTYTDRKVREILQDVSEGKEEKGREMIKVLELFGGIGSQTQALKNIGIEHKSTLCEIDKYAVETYNQLHGETENIGDITKVEQDSLVEGQWDLITYSFPCQSVSIAGKQEGLTKDTGTESSLLWECEKIIKKVKPKYLLMENVANLLSKKFFPEFEKWLNILKSLGYSNYWKILNAKDYGIPQNRERVFCVSIRGEHNYYQFPKPIELKLRLENILEDSVDEKYYLNKKTQDKFVFKNENKKEENELIREPKIDRIGGMYNQATRWGVYNEKGISPTITASMGMGGGHIPMIKRVGKLETKGFDCCKGVYATDGICPTVTAMGGDHIHKIIIPQSKVSFRIRKLTPRECWRLMGWKDDEFNKIKGISNAQLYKQAGNSIVVNVLEAIFRQMFLVDSKLPKKIELEQKELF